MKYKGWLIAAGMLLLVILGAVIIKAAWGQEICTVSYKTGTSVTVTAKPCPGWTFTGWSGDGTCTGKKKTCTFIMSKDRTVKADFKKLPVPKNLRITEKQMQYCKNEIEQRLGKR